MFLREKQQIWFLKRCIFETNSSQSLHEELVPLVIATCIGIDLGKDSAFFYNAFHISVNSHSYNINIGGGGGREDGYREYYGANLDISC